MDFDFEPPFLTAFVNRTSDIFTGVPLGVSDADVERVLRSGVLDVNLENEAIVVHNGLAPISDFQISK